MSTTVNKEPLGLALEGFRRALLWISIISGMINVLALTGSFYMLQVYDRVLTSHSIPTLVALSAIAIGLYVFQGILDVLRNQASSRAATLFDRRMMPSVQLAILRQPLAGVSRTNAQLPMRDVDTIRAFLASGGPVAFLDLPWMPIYLAFVFAMHPWLGSLCFVGMLVLMALAYLTERLSHDLSRQASMADTSRRGIADANARNAEAIQAMGFGDRAIFRFETANLKFLQMQTSAGDIIATLAGISKVLRLILQSAILGLGAFLTVNGDLSAGAIIAASIATSRALAPVEQVIAHWRGFLSTRQSYGRLVNALSMLPVKVQPLALPKPADSVSVEQLAVAVPGTQRLVLSGVSFELKPGQALAVIGPSAAGKSSLARALTGVWPCLRGTVRIDGATLDRWPPGNLGQLIGYLPQDVALFEGTVSENICRLGESSNSAPIIAAAHAANVHGLILALPEGYETQVGPDGTALSAGQRQRIALARALYGEPFLVVLDEPNSNLDADGEAALTGAIHSVRNRKGIVVVIAHRPSALAAVDLVAVINGGQLIAFGPKDDVLKKVLSPAAVPAVAANTEG